MNLAILVTGDRHAQEMPWRRVVLDAIRDEIGGFDGRLVLIHGAATGIDTIARDVVLQEIRYKLVRNATVEPVPVNPIDWKTFGHGAGPRRNHAMLRRLLALRDEGYRIVVLAFHDDLKNGSTGTKNMVYQAALHRATIPIHTFTSHGGTNVSPLQHRLDI